MGNENESKLLFTFYFNTTLIKQAYGGSNSSINIRVKQCVDEVKKYWEKTMIYLEREYFIERHLVVDSNTGREYIFNYLPYGFFETDFTFFEEHTSVNAVVLAKELDMVPEEHRSKVVVHSSATVIDVGVLETIYSSIPVGMGLNMAKVLVDYKTAKACNSEEELANAFKEKAKNYGISKEGLERITGKTVRESYKAIQKINVRDTVLV